MAPNSFLLVLRGQLTRGNGSHLPMRYGALVLNSHASMVVAPLRRSGHAVDVAIAASDDVLPSLPSSMRHFRQEVESAFGTQTLVRYVVAPTQTPGRWNAACDARAA